MSGWSEIYSKIIKEFKFDEEKDNQSSIKLNSLLKNTNANNKLTNLIRGKTVVVIGSGPSLSRDIGKIGNLPKLTKIAADSSTKILVENQIFPEIIVTDLDGDEHALQKLAKTRSVFVVHAHGHNIEKMEIIRKFKHKIGTTQSMPFDKLQNFGGFTDGDRAVFLASHFGAEKIILIGMDFGDQIGKYSYTKKSERRLKLKKLRRGEKLLEWLSTFTDSELFTTSKPIKGFTKISFNELDTIIT